MTSSTRPTALRRGRPLLQRRAARHVAARRRRPRPAVVRAGHRRDRRPVGRQSGAARAAPPARLEVRRRWASWWRPTTCAASPPTPPRSASRATGCGSSEPDGRMHTWYSGRFRRAHADALVRARARDGPPLRAGEADGRGSLAAAAEALLPCIKSARFDDGARGPKSCDECAFVQGGAAYALATGVRRRAAPSTRPAPSTRRCRSSLRASARTCWEGVRAGAARARPRPHRRVPQRAGEGGQERAQRERAGAGARGGAALAAAVVGARARPAQLRLRAEDNRRARALTRRHNRSRAGRG